MKRLVLVGLLAACASADSVGVTPDAGGGGADASGRQDAGITSDSAVSPDATTVTPNTCATTVTCTSGQMLGTVSGDTGAGTLSASGYQAAWYRVRVTEDFSDAPGLALRLAARLTGPTAGAFDVFVYVNPSADQLECNTTTGTVTTSGTVKEVRAEWGESLIPNGGDDSRDVAIEVRPATGTACAASATWSLQLSGNWL